MRKAILGAASALALASPAVAADLPVVPECAGCRCPGAGSRRFRDRRGSPACHCSAAASGG
jgi:opacity protein-like surface antigen